MEKFFLRKVVGIKMLMLDLFKKYIVGYKNGICVLS